VGNFIPTKVGSITPTKVGSLIPTLTLSRGTAEQLYLALRFGYIRDYAASSLPVPVIFDDILVNFDPERRKNACQAIANLAETCQVLYFTCHPQTVGDLTGAVPDAVVMDISGA